MTITDRQQREIEDVLKRSLRNKFQNYNPEPASMPFHTRLLGKDRLALYSFIHSISTNFGTTIFEPVAVALGKNKFQTVASQVIAGENLSSSASSEIQNIMDNLTTASASPNKSNEIAAIRRVCQTGTMRRIKPTRVDLYVKAHSGEIYLFDIKTAKPNAGSFKEFKRTLLEWVGATLATDPQANVNTLIAIPYNPYEPEPYNRWTMRGMLDLDNELKVAEQFWDFLGGDGAYQALLGCFERVGVELREEIDDYFSRFQSEHR
ncbi:TdeIII family type II restriction endonuclease [Dehalococcoides mccartyi]|jgi:type II restriction enzyme|uniref:TdeIII family type II restriction endonuclease n=1 Tax=Dehalococcoides mccartyi TaxID=61435 RepID=UPI0026F0780F|nr:TdeIII family type II restriction endonuclease [Dehalococcoides mccartyi]